MTSSVVNYASVARACLRCAWAIRAPIWRSVSQPSIRLALAPLEGRPDLRHALLRINRPEKVGVVSLAKLGRQVISIVCLLTASDLSAALKLQ